MKPSVRDFIYLDNERVRSYLAQLNGGLVESKQKTTGHDIATKSSVKADGLSKLFLDAEAGAEYAFQKSTSETSTLHHAAFELVRTQLSNEKLINSEGSSSKPFSEIECHLRLVDYSVLGMQLDHMGLLMPLFDKVAGNKPSQDNKATAKLMKDISKVIELLYGDSKVLQLISTDGKSVIAQATFDESFSSPAQNLFQVSANNVLPGTWKVFCIFDDNVPHLDLPSPSNEISQALAGVTQEMKALKTIVSATDDAANVIPIGIYRELVK